MPPRLWSPLAAALIITLCLCPAAWAFDQMIGTRSLGMGGGLRGAAAGGAGPLLNPSGMSLSQSYSVEAAYLFASARSDHFFHGSIVDSTSGFRVAGGLYYTYHSDNPDGQQAGHGHEVGLAMSFPVGDHVALGGTAKYFNLSGDELPTQGNDQVTFDAGLTIRPAGPLSLGLVGTNLRNLHAGVAPVGIGYGLAYTPITDLLLVVDGATTLTIDAPQTRKGTRVGGGGELLLAKQVALRIGGGYDGVTQNGYFTAGFSAISEIGALDLGVRQDAFREGIAPRQTVGGVTLRLFVPQP